MAAIHFLVVFLALVAVAGRRRRPSLLPTAVKSLTMTLMLVVLVVVKER